MIRVSYLSLEQIIYLHEKEISDYGGSSGIRDLSLLESATYRPQSTFGGSDLYPTLFSKAAALMHSIINNHPFVDGNKRTGTASMLVFLDLNGYTLTSSNTDLVQVALKISLKQMNVDTLVKWLQENSEKLK